MSLSALIDLVVKGGPAAMAGIFLWMWWLERKERRELQKALLTLSTTTIQALTKFEAELERDR